MQNLPRETRDEDPVAGTTLDSDHLAVTQSLERNLGKDKFGGGPHTEINGRSQPMILLRWRRRGCQPPHHRLRKALMPELGTNRIDTGKQESTQKNNQRGKTGKAGIKLEEEFQGHDTNPGMEHRCAGRLHTGSRD